MKKLLKKLKKTNGAFEELVIHGRCSECGTGVEMSANDCSSYYVKIKVPQTLLDAYRKAEATFDAATNSLMAFSKAEYERVNPRPPGEPYCTGVTSG